MSKRYTPEVHAFIAAHVEGCTTKDLAQMVNDALGTEFTAASMKSYKANHKLKSGTPCGLPKGRATDLYPACVAEYIHTHYKGTGYAQMAQQLQAVFGLEYTPTQIMGYYKNHKLNSGLTGRFEKGHISANKGKKGTYAPGCEKGWYRQGNQPWNGLPVGSVIVKTDGYLWKKVSDIPGAKIKNWRQLHILIWESEHGPLPPGHLVVFKDGNKQNCEPDNLMLVTMAENAVMNNKKLRFQNPQHTEVGHTIAKIKIAARKRQRAGGKGL